MSQRKQLSEEAFNQATAGLVINERRATAAKNYLVDGMPQKTIATQLQITPSAVAQAVAYVWKAHMETHGVPRGMRRITVTLPTDQAAIALEWQREALHRQQR